MTRFLRGLTAALTLFLLMIGCSSGPPGKSVSEVEKVRQDLLAVIQADARLADENTPLSHDDYRALAEKLAKVPGVTSAQYAGDGLGSISVGVDGGGRFDYRHVTDDITHEPLMPDGFDYATLTDPKWNPGFAPPEVVTHPRASGTYATHFPVASINPDPDYVADEQVRPSCPKEGSIAIVDFYYTEVKEVRKLLYNNEFDIDGKEIWTRLEDMGKAAGFTVDFYKDDQVNLSNFVGILKTHTYVIVNGHGSTPGPANIDRTHEAMVTFVTPEKYDPAKRMENGKTYEEAWKAGWINRGLEVDTVRWTPRLIQAVYAPAVPQQWLISTCFAMQPSAMGFVPDSSSPLGWTFRTAAFGDFYNFGHALREKLVKTVFGYTNKANVWVVASNLMAFFRHQFGGFFEKDRPPAPLTYWPTCMSSQTYFRRSTTPAQSVYANKLDGTSLYTMYSEPDPVYLRQTCRLKPPNQHASMQDFMLAAGTPATAFQSCWDRYWGQGKAASITQDALCSKGDFPTGTEAVRNAGCNVMIARKATNAMLP